MNNHLIKSIELKPVSGGWGVFVNGNLIDSKPSRPAAERSMRWWNDNYREEDEHLCQACVGTGLHNGDTANAQCLKCNGTGNTKHGAMLGQAEAIAQCLGAVKVTIHDGADTVTFDRERGE
jgi:hypothetical protein